MSHQGAEPPAVSRCCTDPDGRFACLLMLLPVTNAADTIMASPSHEGRPVPPGELSLLLSNARLRVLRATILICLLISIGNLVGAVVGFTASGHVTGPAPLLGAVWCVAWIVAAAFPAVTARLFGSWRQTALVLVTANALTVGLTGGIDSPLLAVCMYVGWSASVVIWWRAAVAMTLGIGLSIVVGYVLAGASLSDIVSGPYRYAAVTNVALPLFAGVIGVLLATVTNTAFSGVGATVADLRAGAPATTPGLTALMAGRPVLELHPGVQSPSRRTGTGAPLTGAEREVLRLLADGYAPKQIARLRGVALSTVRSQLKRAKQKTGARTLPELALYAAP
jgi:DNA-binding CsgD family transcriptional regulator